VYWAAFDRDGGRIITGSADGLVVWDVASLSIVARHADFGDRSVIRGAFSPDRERLAVVSWDGTAAVFDCATWTMQARLKGHQTRPRGISWSMDGQRVITSEENALLHVWYPGRRPFAPVFDGHHGRVTTVAFTPDDSGILSVSNDTVRSFERSTGQIRFSITSRRSIAGMRAGIDGGRFIIFGATGLAEVYSSHDGALLAGLDAGKYPITNALFFDGGARAVTVAEDGQVRIHDVASTRSLKTISAHPGPIASAAIHEGRRWLATGGSDRTIRIFDIDSGAAVFASTPWPGPERGLDPLGHVFDVAFDAAGARL
jgi:WD40 repeat protein